MAGASVRDRARAAHEYTVAERQRMALERQQRAADEALELVRRVLDEPHLEGGVTRDERQPGEWHVQLEGLELIAVPAAAELFLAAIDGTRLPSPLEVSCLSELGEFIAEFSNAAAPPVRL